MVGRKIKDFAPNAQNNRNSEGDFIRLKDGSILFIYSRYSSEGFEDGCACDLYASVSTDEGESFSEPYPILLHTDLDADNIMSVSLMRMQNEDIGMFFCFKKDVVNCLPYFIRSSDEGKTWHSLTPCFKEKAYYCLNNDRVIRLKSGRIIVPVCHFIAQSKVDENGNEILASIGTGTFYTFASDDDGKSFNLLSTATIPVSKACKTGVHEPGVVELKDGRLWCYIRNDSGRQYQTFSSDEGESWSEPELSQFTSPVSPMSADRLSDGRIVAVWNPIPLYNGRSLFHDGFWTDGRNPLVIAVSSDEAETFSEYKAIETDERRGYAYTAIFETKDNSILLAYCAGGAPEDVHSMLERTRITKISIDEI